MRTLTKEEVTKYQPAHTSKYALLDKSRESIFLDSDTQEFCEETLRRMTPEHPKYKDMELVKIPEE